jgi:hypothetical protein
LNVLPVIDLSKEDASYFEELNQLILEYPPLPSAWWTLFRLARVGIGPGRRIVSGEQRALLAAAVPGGLARVRQKLTDTATIANGWRVNTEVTEFIRDPTLRAGTVLYGPGFHIAEEALYFSTNNLAGAPPSGQSKYRLRFPAGQTPPVDAFWSLTFVGPDLALVENPIHRYAVHDRTEGLQTAHADRRGECRTQTCRRPVPS